MSQIPLLTEPSGSPQRSPPASGAQDTIQPAPSTTTSSSTTTTPASQTHSTSHLHPSSSSILGVPSLARPRVHRARTESTLGPSSGALDPTSALTSSSLSHKNHQRRHSSRGGTVTSNPTTAAPAQHSNSFLKPHHHSFFRTHSFVNSTLRDTKIPSLHEPTASQPPGSSSSSIDGLALEHHRLRGSRTQPQNYSAISRSGDPGPNNASLHVIDNNSNSQYGARFSPATGTGRTGFLNSAFVRRLSSSASLGPHSSNAAKPPARTFYDDFTTVDWVHETVQEYDRKSQLQALRGFRGQVFRLFDAAQGWILITIVAFVFALIVYAIDKCEPVLADWREGYCRASWLQNKGQCCAQDDGDLSCPSWREWDLNLNLRFLGNIPLVYMGLTLLLPLMSVSLTLLTRIPAAPFGRGDTVYYAGAGSGVAEVKTILSGFIMRRFLGTYTLINKSISLLLVISSGLAVGKEGPYVHLATCVGNIGCRLFAKFSENEKKRRQILSAAASAGVALAFGSPLGGVLFSLEEVSYYFLPHQLFRIFFCAMISALFLKFLDPYGTGKIVLFEVAYPHDWMFWELGYYIFLGICGGIYGALFCKFCLWWGKKVAPLRKSWPVSEVVVVALITGLISFHNPFTAKPVSELLLDLASTCTVDGPSLALCPTNTSQIPKILSSLLFALVVKIFLTSITFGLKVPSGIYVPSMVVGALFGRILALCLEYVDASYDQHSLLTYLTLRSVSSTPMTSIPFSTVGGTYAMAGAGAFLAGVTRMNVTLAIILFELTGSLNHVLPFSLTILVANWVSNAIEPESLYELLLHRNNFPYLDNRTTRAFNISLIDLVKQSREVVDVTQSYFVNAQELRDIVRACQSRGEFDGCIPIVNRNRQQHLCGVIDVPQLEFSLDKIEQYALSVGTNFPQLECWMGDNEEKESSVDEGYLSSSDGPGGNDADSFQDVLENELERLCDLSSITNHTPVLLDVQSPLALVEMMFTQLGTRYVCVTSDAQFVGILHRKRYIDYCKNHMHD